MKTTLDLRDDLLARAKELAARERTSLTRIIEESLTLRLRRDHPHHRVALDWLARARTSCVAGARFHAARERAVSNRDRADRR